jgi:hypothetical protein
VHPFLDGAFLSRLPPACWGGRLSMEAQALIFWASSCTFLSLSQQRPFTTEATIKLDFLREHPLVCGLFFGGAGQEVMNLVVLPLPRFTPEALTNYMT